MFGLSGLRIVEILVEIARQIFEDFLVPYGQAVRARETENGLRIDRGVVEGFGGPRPGVAPIGQGNGARELDVDGDGVRAEDLTELRDPLRPRDRTGILGNLT